MPARFCSQCGSQAMPRAKFCMECGQPLAGTAPAASGGAPRRTTGTVVFGGFLLAGLGIWAAILTPDPPLPPLGGKAGPTAARAAATTQPTIKLPDEITKMVAELATKAAAKPDDLNVWTHLGEVYYRTAQFDGAYQQKALEAFDHVLARDPKRAEALRGKANVYYDRQEPKLAIPLYERYVELHGEDSSVRTDLATMHFYDGQTEKAIAMFKSVLARDPHFVQAHYNLAAAYHDQGNIDAALEQLRAARKFATDERVQQQIDQMIVKLSGAPTTPPPAPTAPAAAPSPDPSRTPFQQVVEQRLRTHDIVGPRIAELRWTAPGVVEARMREFPMAQMPPMARAAFEKRIVGFLTEAQVAHPVDGDLAVVVVDAGTSETMARIAP